MNLTEKKQNLDNYKETIKKDMESLTTKLNLCLEVFLKQIHDELLKDKESIYKSIDDLIINFESELDCNELNSELEIVERIISNKDIEKIILFNTKNIDKIKLIEEDNINKFSNKMYMIKNNINIFLENSEDVLRILSNSQTQSNDKFYTLLTNRITKILEYESKLKELSKEFRVEMENIEALRKEVNCLTNERDYLKSNIESLKNSYKNMKDECIKLEENLVLKRSDLQVLSYACMKLEMKIDNLNNIINTKEKILFHVSDELKTN